jgi:YVTN family beta-propeller protein
MQHQIRSTAGPAFFSLIVWFLVSGFAPTAVRAHTLAISPDGHRLYVSVLGPTEELEVIDGIDTQTNAVLTTIPVRIPIGLHAPLALSPDGSVLYAESDIGTVTLYAIDVASGKLVATVPLGRFGETGGIGDLAVSQDGSRVYALGGDSRTSLSVVSVVDAATQKTVAAIPVFGASEALTPDGKKLYVTGGYSGGTGMGVVSVIDTATNHLTATVNVQPLPWGAAVSPGSRRVYVTHIAYNSAVVDVINAVTDELDKTVSLPGGASLAPVVSPDGSRLYLFPFPWNIAAAVSTRGAGVLGTVGAGGSLMDQVISPGGDRLYMLTLGGSGPDGSVTVVNTSSFQVVGTINLSKTPAGRP